MIFLCIPAWNEYSEAITNAQALIANHLHASKECQTGSVAGTLHCDGAADQPERPAAAGPLAQLRRGRRRHADHLRDPAPRREGAGGAQLRRGRARRGAGDQEPRQPDRARRLRAARGLSHRPHRDAGREPARRAVEPDALREPRAPGRPLGLRRSVRAPDRRGAAGRDRHRVFRLATSARDSKSLRHRIFQAVHQLRRHRCRDRWRVQERHRPRLWNGQRSRLRREHPRVDHDPRPGRDHPARCRARGSRPSRLSSKTASISGSRGRWCFPASSARVPCAATPT